MSPIQNYSSSTSSSNVGDGGNYVEVGMDDFLQNTQAMEGNVARCIPTKLNRG